MTSFETRSVLIDNNNSDASLRILKESVSPYDMVRRNQSRTFGKMSAAEWTSLALAGFGRVTRSSGPWLLCGAKRGFHLSGFTVQVTVFSSTTALEESVLLSWLAMDVPLPRFTELRERFVIIPDHPRSAAPC